MRGKVANAVASERVAGITPAYAGKRITVKRGSRVSRDHPRLCGEKYVPRILRCFHRGSPPPMRGKGSEIVSNGHENRITPAYAGKRQEQLEAEVTVAGSPPPMRGKD